MKSILKDASGFSNISGLVNQIENKYCRVLCSSDGSSTMIQVISGQTVYQALNKIFIRKNVPWFKCGKIIQKKKYGEIFYSCFHNFLFKICIMLVIIR